jgi:ABC-type antimicrobial peptide transport system permease subunit
MVKELALQLLLLVTIASGIVSVLAGAGWFLGAMDGLLVLKISVPIFIVAIIVVSFVKNGFSRLLAESLVLWPF